MNAEQMLERARAIGLSPKIDMEAVTLDAILKSAAAVIANKREKRTATVRRAEAMMKHMVVTLQRAFNLIPGETHTFDLSTHDAYENACRVLDAAVVAVANFVQKKDQREKEVGKQITDIMGGEARYVLTNGTLEEFTDEQIWFLAANYRDAVERAAKAQNELAAIELVFGNAAAFDNAGCVTLADKAKVCMRVLRNPAAAGFSVRVSPAEGSKHG